VIEVSDQGDAYVNMRLLARASYPTGIGESIIISIPYHESRVSIMNVTTSNEPANYTINSSENEITIQVALQSTLYTVPLQVIYSVKDVYDQSTFEFRFKQSSTTNELAINIVIETQTTWIDRRSLNLSPEASKDTYFQIAEEAMPFDISFALSNVAPEEITLSLKTQEAPIRLQDVPFLALPLSAFPWGIIAISRLIGLFFIRKDIGVLNIAYRNMIRRPVRFSLTLLGVLIPSSLLIILLIQAKMAQQILGTSSDKLDWSLLMVLFVAIVIGGFQVVNSVFSSVLERIRELGVMKAVGFKYSFIRNTVLAEAVLLGLIAGFLGAIIGVGYIILSYNPFYGGDLPGDVVASIMANTFGEVNIFRPMSLIENPWYRNYLLASLVMMVICFKSFFMTESSGGLISSTALFFLLIRPIDPFLATLLMDASSLLAENIIIATFFAVGISTLAGLYVSRQINKINATEAMRHI
jgi:ABC-type antimicrobial peptide transport system permease subunit